MIKLLDISTLHPIEDFIEKLIPFVQKETIKDNYWLEVIKIEKHNLILDGHHKFEIAKRLHLKRMPCIVFDYDDLEMWSLRDDVIINNKQEVINFVLKGNLYPNKTVKHKFPDIDYKCKIKIDELM